MFLLGEISVPRGAEKSAEVVVVRMLAERRAERRTEESREDHNPGRDPGGAKATETRRRGNCGSYRRGGASGDR
jgi:hypothetical protein